MAEAGVSGFEIASELATLRWGAFAERESLHVCTYARMHVCKSDMYDKSASTAEFVGRTRETAWHMCVANPIGQGLYAMR